MIEPIIIPTWLHRAMISRAGPEKVDRLMDELNIVAVADWLDADNKPKPRRRRRD